MSFQSLTDMFVVLSEHGEVLRGIHPNYGPEIMDPCHRAFRTPGFAQNIFNRWYGTVQDAMDNDDQDTLHNTPDFFMWLEEQDPHWKDPMAVFDVSRQVIPYFDHDNRQQMHDLNRMSFHNGIIRQFGRSARLVSEEALHKDELEHPGTRHQANEVAFVVLENPHSPGELMFYYGVHRDSEFHHSSLGGNARVIGAGMMTVDNGKITAIRNKSGHYKPNARRYLKAIHYLNQQGVLADNCHFNAFDMQRYTEENVTKEDGSKLKYAKGTPILNEWGDSAGSVGFESNNYDEITAQLKTHIDSFTRTPEEVALIKAEAAEREQLARSPDVDEQEELERIATRLQRIARASASKRARDKSSPRFQDNQLPLAVMFQTDSMGENKDTYNVLVVSPNEVSAHNFIQHTKGTLDISHTPQSEDHERTVHFGRIALNLSSVSGDALKNGIDTQGYDFVFYLGNQSEVQHAVQQSQQACAYGKLYQLSYPTDDTNVSIASKDVAYDTQKLNTALVLPIVLVNHAPFTTRQPPPLVETLIDTIVLLTYYNLTIQW